MISFQHYIIISLQAMIAIVLTRTFGLAVGSIVDVFLLLVWSAIGFVLLRQINTESITWRNRVIAILMPWPAIVGGGTATMLTIKNTIAAILFAVIVIVCDHIQLWNLISTTNNDTADSKQPAIGIQIISIANVVCWAILLFVWMWVLKSRTVRNTNNRRILVPLIIPPITLILSIVLHIQGHPVWAFLVVAIPLLCVLLPIVLMCIFILGHWITGKPIRWN